MTLKTEITKLFKSFKADLFQVSSFRMDQKEFSKQLLDTHSSLANKFKTAKSELIKSPAQSIEIKISGQVPREAIKLTKKQFHTLCFVTSRRLGVIEKYPKLINIMLLVYLVALFDAFILDAVKTTLRYRKEILKSSKQITYEQVLAFNKIDDLKSHIVETEIIELSHKSYNDQSRFLTEKFGIDLSKCGLRTETISEIVMTRNLLVHNKGVVNRIYRNANPDSPFHIDDERIITDEYLDDSSKTISTVAEFLYSSLVHKFC